VFCSVGFVFALHLSVVLLVLFLLCLCFVLLVLFLLCLKGKAKTKPTKQNTKAKQKRKPTEEKRGQYKRSQPKEGLAYQASHTTPVVECLLLYSLIDISANICLTRQCLTIQIPVKDLTVSMEGNVFILRIFWTCNLTVAVMTSPWTSTITHCCAVIHCKTFPSIDTVKSFTGI
jgi:Ca2+/Na+ antiporter